jgi:2-phospho-L-lactate guanylyltransferase
MSSAESTDSVSAADHRWRVLVPVKDPLHAKSRLSEALGERRPGLALAFARDTVLAALSCDLVAEVAVVTRDEGVAEVMRADGARVLDEGSATGLNDAITYALASAPQAADTAVLLGDLPALTPAALRQALLVAGGFDAAFVADAAATGTTLLCARRGRPIRPRFGLDSARAHANAGATEIVDAAAALRRDVDSLEDLAEAARIGLGRHSRELLRDVGLAGLR